MGPRTILHTGTGGAGTTAVAAATARRCAAAGHRTLLLALDPGPALAEALGAPVGADVTDVGGGLSAQAAGAADALAGRWDGLRARLAGLPADPAELAVPPGADGVAGLLALGARWDEGGWDAIVVDAGPLPASLRLLAAPGAARGWLDRALPAGRRAGGLHDAARRLVELNEVLGDRDRTTVRLVLAPDAAGATAVRRAATALGLHGLLVDAVCANRVLPADPGPWLAAERGRQAERLAALEAAFAPVPVLRAPWLVESGDGVDLDALGAALLGDRDPLAVLHRRPAQAVTVTRTGAELRLDLPFATAADVTLTQRGLDLVVRVGDAVRTVALPPALADYRPAGATVRDGALLVLLDRDRAAQPADA
jgi:arsenite/tail-anchored protein-transporting ATPase